MEAPRRYFKGIDRYTYLNDPDINPLILQEINRQKADKDGKRPPLIFTADTLAAANAAAAHQNMSAEFQRAYEVGDPEEGYPKAGDPQAMFDYADADYLALEDKWVRQQIEKWILEHTTESRKNLDKFWKCLTSAGKGKRRLLTRYAIIKKDMQIAKAVSRLKLRYPKKTLRYSDRHGAGCYEIVARSKKSNVDDVEKIYRRYKSKFDHYMGKVTPLDRRIHQLLKKKGVIPLDQKPIPPPRLLASRKEVFAWLDEMLANIERAVERGEEEPDS